MLLCFCEAFPRIGFEELDEDLVAVLEEADDVFFFDAWLFDFGLPKRGISMVVWMFDRWFLILKGNLIVETGVVACNLEIAAKYVDLGSSLFSVNPVFAQKLYSRLKVNASVGK